MQTLMGPTGAQLVEQTKLYLSEDAVIDERSQVSYGGRVVPIQGMKTVKDEWGHIDHFEVFF